MEIVRQVVGNIFVLPLTVLILSHVNPRLPMRVYLTILLVSIGPVLWGSYLAIGWMLDCLMATIHAVWPAVDVMTHVLAILTGWVLRMAHVTICMLEELALFTVH